MELSSPKFKKLLYFFPKTKSYIWGMDISSFKPEKTKKFLYFSKKSPPYVLGCLINP